MMYLALPYISYCIKCKLKKDVGWRVNTRFVPDDAIMDGINSNITKIETSAFNGKFCFIISNCV